MPPSNSNRWTTDPDYIELLNYLIKRTKNVESPMNIKPLVREFKEKSGAAQTVSCLNHRIKNLRTMIHSFEHIDKTTKVKILFAFSGSVDAKFLKKLKKDAVVEVDDKKRITYYKANDGSLEFRGDHSHSAKTKNAKSQPSVSSLIRDYFAKKNNADAVPMNGEEKEVWKLIDFITENCENSDSPLNIRPLARDFNKHLGTTRSLDSTYERIKIYCLEIHETEFIETRSKVKQLFGLSVKLDSNYLDRLRTEALVEIDEKNRITYYKATDGSLELRGDHSLSAKQRTAQLESKRSHRSMIIDYFENKNNIDAVPKNVKEKEMWNLIEFITEKCEIADSPLRLEPLANEFKCHFGISRPLVSIFRRIKGYCREIQRLEFLDTHSKVKQLFGLSATVDLKCLENLRKTAVVEVDQKNRIIKGGLSLKKRSPHGSKKEKPRRVKKTNKDNVVTTADDLEEESDNERFNDSSDEYSSEEFDSEFNSDDGINDSEVAEDLVKSTNEAIDFNNETPVRNRSPTEISIDDNLDFDSPTVRSHRSEDTERSEDEESNPEIIGNASVKTRYRRLSKRRHLNSKISYNKANFSSSEVPMRTDLLSPKSVKQKKSTIQKKQALRSSNQSRSSSRSMRRSTRNSSFPLISTESKENMENQDAQEAVDFDNESSMRNDSPAKVSTAENFDFDPSPKKSRMSEGIEMGEDKEKENDSEITGKIKKIYEKLSEKKYSDSEDDSDSHPKDSDDENDDLDMTQDPMEPANKADDSDNETSVRSLAHSGISIDDNFDFDPPTERSNVSEEIGMNEDDVEITENAAVKTQRSETLPEGKTSSSTSHTLKAPKRKADKSAGSTSSKRTKPSSDNKSMNPEGMNDNSSHDEPPRIELNPFDRPPGLPKKTQKDSDVQQIPKPHPQVMEVPIKEEYEEETQTSLKTVLNAYKSLILGLDTSGLSKLQMDLDKLMLEAGRRSDVSTKEVIMAMDFLIVKLAKHGALESSEDSISLRDILLMLRTIILNSSFNGLEVILEMLKKHIDQLKVLDKKVLVSKVESVLRATLDSIST